jgi:hypothetical protein
MSDSNGSSSTNSNGAITVIYGSMGHLQMDLCPGCYLNLDNGQDHSGC